MLPCGWRISPKNARRKLAEGAWRLSKARGGKSWLEEMMAAELARTGGARDMAKAGAGRLGRTGPRKNQIQVTIASLALLVSKIASTGGA